MRRYILIVMLLTTPLVMFAQNKKNEHITKSKVIKDEMIDVKERKSRAGVLDQPTFNLKLDTSFSSVKIRNNIDKWEKGRRWAIGLQIGTDIGGAIPVPFKYIPSTFNPYPKLNISVGTRLSWSYNHRWSVHVEATYKQVKMLADARVENQKFQQNGQMQYFSGTAKMNMDFTMMEFPIYAKWAVSKHYNDFITLGGYYSYGLSPNFVTTALNGYIGGAPDEFAGAIKPNDPMIMDFTEYLGKHDMGILVGYERRVWNRANISLRVMVGFADIFRSDTRFFDYKMWQMRGTINLEYDLFLIK